MTTTSARTVEATVADAASCSSLWSSSDAEKRAALLNGLATALEEAQVELVQIADEETFLGTARLNGELARTAFQLRGFATHVLAGFAYAFVNDEAVAGPPPAGHPHMIRVRVPVGPVAMFSASNFPFAFSVLGGDTASALAAGCVVIVKAHPGHPRLSRRVHQIAQAVLSAQGLPAPLISMVDGESIEVGVQLIRHPKIAAAAFTGSVRGGLALQAEALGRERPIPFYGELGSINPVIALPGVLATKGAELARLLAQSITNGSGQFCTSPGVIIVFGDAASHRFVLLLGEALAEQKTHPMLTNSIRKGFDEGVKRVAGRGGVELVSHGRDETTQSPSPFLARTDANTFVSDVKLHEEVFGPAAIVVQVDTYDEIVAVLKAIGGSLTATIWGADEASEENIQIVRAASQVAGRVLFSGVPTGVAVTAAQHHGGPFPSSTQPFTTSVGYAAMDRFLRPITMQDAPAWLVSRGGRPV